MSIGKMKKKIILRKPDVVSDSRGGRKTRIDGSDGFTDVATVWAEFITPNVSLVESQGTIVSEMTRKISIWKRNDVKMGWQVTYGTKTSLVEHAYEYSDTLMTLVCREVVK